MGDSVLGEGLVFEELIPIAWVSGPPLQGPALARLNADNQQLLAAEASIGEVRAAEALKDESPALLHELQRLEYKLNVLLRLTAELAAHFSPLPEPQRVRLASRGLEWFGAKAPARASTGLAQLYLNPALPQPLRMPCIVASERREGSERVAQLAFSGVSEAVETLLDKLIFRHHRRQVAGARSASP